MLDERRRELLAAIGIELYCLRAPAADAAGTPAHEPATTAAGVRVAIAIPRGIRGDAGLASLLAQLVRALGIGAAEAAWIETDGERVEAPLPEVGCYLMLGAAAARAGSAQLPLERQRAATIAVSAECGELFRDAASRRALWQALKPLVQRLHSA